MFNETELLQLIEAARVNKPLARPRGHFTTAEFGEALGVERRTATRRLEQLERAGIVSRVEQVAIKDGWGRERSVVGWRVCRPSSSPSSRGETAGEG